MRYIPNSPLRFLTVIAVVCLGLVPMTNAQFVDVTLTLDTNTLAVGETTQLRVWAQVVAPQQTNAERIVTWHLDVLNLGGAVADADYDSMLKTASDNDPLTASTGTEDGANRRGVFDTFLDLSKSGIGVTNPVELMSIPVMSVAGGVAEFQVAAGTGEPLLSADFLVAPLGGGDPMIGGNYGAASVQLTVEAACALQLQIAYAVTPGVLALSFVPCVGYDHTVESANLLTTNTVWTALPGAPHNSGNLSVTNTVSPRFYRVRADLP